jgi:hypothetical protein
MIRKIGDAQCLTIQRIFWVSTIFHNLILRVFSFAPVDTIIIQGACSKFATAAIARIPDNIDRQFAPSGKQKLHPA